MYRGRIFSSLLVAALLLITAHRLPAPISEIPESPTPSSEQSAKPKPKRTIKPKVTNENSESLTKRQTASPTPKNQAIPNLDPFGGRWVGTFENAEFTLTITARGTIVTTDVPSQGVNTNQATCNGRSMKWTRGWAYWTLAPNSDGTTAVVNITFDGFVEGSSHSSVIFRKMSP